MPEAAYLADTRVKRKRSWLVKCESWYHFLVSFVGGGVVILIIADAIANNWAINDYLGDGYFFVTPIAAVENAMQLMNQYVYAKNLGISNLSNIGQWIANYTVVSLITKSNRVYLLSVGEYPLTTSTSLCPSFMLTYPVDLSSSNTVKLAYAVDSISFYRGDAISHILTSDRTDNLATTSMSSSQIRALGYVPGRMNIDMRFTRDIKLLNTSALQNQVVSYFRIFPRSFCTGCEPTAELGYSVCNFTMQYNDTTKTLNVVNSTFVPGSMYSLGLVMENSAFGVFALYTKLFAIFFAVGGYLASRRTVQWLDIDPNKPNTIYTRLMRTVVPKYFPYPSHALSYDIFCYNSDIFVFLYACSVLFDLQSCLIFVREVNLYNNPAPQFIYSLQMLSLSSRLLWINCALLKLCKILWYLLGTATYNGESRMMGFFNLSSVTSLYLSSIVLFYIPQFIEYNNSVAITMKNTVEKIDGTRVSVFQGFYMRVFSSIILGLFLNMLVITALDRLWNYKRWIRLSKNSLARQAIYNSSSIVCDFFRDVEDDTESGDAIIVCKARRLSTLQWFFMSHLTCFGLPERELRAKKMSIVQVLSTNCKPAHDSSTRTNSVTNSTQVTITGDSHEGYLVVQDGDRNIHLLDAMLNDVTSLVRLGVWEGKWRKIASRLYRFIVRTVGFCVVLLLLMDAFINNWALNDFLGSGYFFMTPIGAVQYAKQLDYEYSFAKGFSIQDLSDMGQWMSNFTIKEMLTKSHKLHIISAGQYDLTPKTELCSIFQGSYAYDINSSPSIKLGVASDATSFFRGNAIDILLGDDATKNLPTPTMKSAELKALGFRPGRTTVDKRFTREFRITNSSMLQQLNVSYFRIFSRNFCTGCDPVAELGFSACAMTIEYNHSQKSLQVTKSEFFPGSTYKLGFTMTNSSFSKASLVIKAIAILFAIGGYVASRHTVQWHEVDFTKPDTLFSRLLRTIEPKYFPYPSYALSYDMFCYNSDIFVFMYSICVIFDIQNCFLYIRNVNLYNFPSPQFLVSLEMFSLSCRMLWVNCALIKSLKLVWNVIGLSSYNGDSILMGFFNLSSVLYLYLSAVLLFYIPEFIEYNNSVTIDLHNQFESIDGICVEFSDGSYMRVASCISIGLVINVLLVLALDHLINYRYWKLLAMNSLARHAVYNSSSILCDYLAGIDMNDSHGSHAVLECKARRISTLQWFFNSHLTSFGLPEKRLKAKKQSPLRIRVKAQRKLISGRSLRSIRDTSENEHMNIMPSSSLPEEGSYIIVQDGEQNMHILDNELKEISASVFNIKIVQDATIKIQ
ncbi:hypothetical protein THRCLA_04040 [Thraustotheca clavata]|uniref:Uncharacterized protein n=1 Tax=Thraustotheca clavata TaxID=74557 RepID=A0A1W0A038_9STRA|nr:hypothetical protein THRCLA_04040 [Thraustotheca clavata]